MANINDEIGKALNLPDPWYVSDLKFDHALKTLDIFISFKKGSLFPCPDCKLICPVYDTKERTWRHLDFFDYKTTFHADLPRIICEGHRVKTIEVNWAEKGSNFTIPFEILMLSFAKEMSVAAVAVLMNIHQDSVWRVLERYVMREVKKMDLSGIRIVGVDEFSIGKDYNYVTIFGDLSGDQAKLIFIVQGKDQKTIAKFRKRLGNQFEGKWFKHMVFCLDMSNAYRAGIEEKFPGAKLVFDRFHVMMNANKAVDDIRKSENVFNEELAKTKYIFLKNPENLTVKQRLKLDSIKGLDLDTVKAYHLKLALQRFWDCASIQDASLYLRRWCSWALRSKLRPMIRVGGMIKSHWVGVINSLRYGLSNGPMEGLVNKMRTAIKRAYGFKTLKNFKTIAYLIAGNINLPTRC